MKEIFGGSWVYYEAGFNADPVFDIAGGYDDPDLVSYKTLLAEIEGGKEENPTESDNGEPNPRSEEEQSPVNKDTANKMTGVSSYKTTTPDEQPNIVNDASPYTDDSPDDPPADSPDDPPADSPDDPPDDSPDDSPAASPDDPPAASTAEYPDDSPYTEEPFEQKKEVEGDSPYEEAGDIKGGDVNGGYRYTDQEALNQTIQNMKAVDNVVASAAAITQARIGSYNVDAMDSTIGGEVLSKFPEQVRVLFGKTIGDFCMIGDACKVKAKSQIEAATGKSFEAAAKDAQCEYNKDSQKIACIVDSGTISEVVATEIAALAKPKGPAHTTEWLNNRETDIFLSDLIPKVTNYKHFPFNLIDFMTYEERGLANKIYSSELFARPDSDRLDLIDITQFIPTDGGRKSFGCVLNTDKYGNSGKHWFAIFCEIRNNECEFDYFNSAAGPDNDTLDAIKDFYEKKVAAPLKGKVAKIEFVNMPAERGNTSLQRDSHSCGVWTIFFLICRAMGVGVEEFKSTNVNDDDMLKLRRIMFLPKA